MRIYHVFLASSYILKKERKKFIESFFDLNNDLSDYGVFLKLDMWETLDAGIDPERKQNFYNRHLQNCDILVLMYWGELGKFTKEEYELARDLLKTGKPWIYVYKKTSRLPADFIPNQENVTNLAQLEQCWSRADKEQWPYEFKDSNQMVKKFHDDVLKLFKDPEASNFVYDDLFSKKISYDNLKQNVTLYGRKNDIEKISSHLSEENTRLITLIGPGGTGKSTLAIQAANENKTKFIHGAVFVELAPLGEKGEVAQEIISTLKDIKIGFSSDDKKPLIEYLKDKKLLIILDNCEYLLDQCKEIIDKIIRHCPGVKIIATSQKRFNRIHDNEKQELIGPLDRPEKSMTDDQLELNPCIQLFLYQAKKVEPKFKLSKNTRDDIIDICNFMGRIPLGIKLAASFLYVKSLEDIKNGIKGSFRKFGENFDDGVSHHQTIEKAIDWSYNLLNEEQKDTFVKLAVFADDFSQEAAGYISGQTENSDDVFFKLANSNIITRSSSSFLQTKTFFILEPIRLYGREKLRNSPYHDLTNARFIAYYVGLTSKFITVFFTREQARQLKMIEEQYKNIVEAIDLATTLNDRLSVIRICSSLWRYWEVRSLFKEGVLRLLSALEIIQEEKQVYPELFLELLHGIGGLYYRGGEIDVAVEWFNRHLEESRLFGDTSFGKANMAHALSDLANVKLTTDKKKAKKLFDEAYRILKGIDDKRLVAILQNNLGNFHNNEYTLNENSDHLTQACEFYTKSIKTFESANNFWESGYPLYGQGSVYYQLGKYKEAFESFTLAYDRRKEADDKRNMGRCQNYLALIDMKEGNDPLKRLEEAFVFLRKAGDSISQRELYLTIIQYCCLIKFDRMAVAIYSFINRKYTDERVRKKYLEIGAINCIKAIHGGTDALTFSKWESEAAGLAEEKVNIFSEIEKQKRLI